MLIVFLVISLHLFRKRFYLGGQFSPLNGSSQPAGPSRPFCYNGDRVSGSKGSKAEAAAPTSIDYGHLMAVDQPDGSRYLGYRGEFSFT